MKLPRFFLAGGLFLAVGNTFAASDGFLADGPAFFERAADCVAVFKAHALEDTEAPLEDVKREAQSGLTFALVGYNMGLRNPKAKALFNQAELKLMSMTRAHKQDLMSSCHSKSDVLYRDLSGWDRSLLAMGVNLAVAKLKK